MFKGLTKKEVNKTVRYSSKKEDDEDKKKSSAKNSLRTKETSSTNSAKGGKNKSDSTGTKRQSAKANRSGNKRRLSDTQRQYQEEQYKTKAVPQAIARLTEKAINDVALAPVSIPYQIATGKKLVDMGLEPTTKSAEVGAAVGNIAGDILSYGTGYKAAEKAVGKAASKALATKTGQKAVEKAVSSKVGKKVGEKTIKKVAESATKSAIADATVGTTLNLSHARSEGLEGKELAQDMALNAALDLGIGGAIEALPIAKALVKSGKTTAKEATQQTAKDTLRKASESTQTAEKSVNAELPTKATKTAENGKVDLATKNGKQAGRVTYIQNPYKGEMPKITTKVISKPSEISAQTMDDVRYILHTTDNKSELKHELKERFGNPRTVTVNGLSFNGEPYKVNINKKSIGKIVSDGTKEQNIAFLSVIDDALKNAEYVGSGSYVPHSSKQKKTVRFDYFESDVKLGGEDYIAKIDVEAFPDVNNYKTHNVEKIELIPKTGADVGPQPTAADLKSTLKQSIPDSAENVKLKDLGADTARPNQTVKEAAEQYGTYDGTVPKANEYGKVTQGASTVYNSPLADDKMKTAIKENLAEGSYWTRKTTNKEKLEAATTKIKENGLDNATESFLNISKEGREIKSDDIAMGYQLAKEHINKGNYDTAQSILSDICQMESEAGRNLQAMRLFNSLSPEGRVKSVVRSAQKISEHTGVDVKLSDEMLESLRNATEDELGSIKKEISQELWEQVPATFAEKLTAWRYLAMLGNPRTHIRNIVGNALYVPVVRMDNAIQTGLQKVLSRKMDKVGAKKTTAILTASSDDRALRKAAKEQFDKLRNTIDAGNGKYNEEYRPQEAKLFNLKLLEWARNFNSNALEAEDKLFMGATYNSAFAQYCKANGKKVGDLTEDFIQEASEHAYNEALRATYRDPSKLAEALSKFRRNLDTKATDTTPIKAAKTAGKVVMDSALPFTKTPINILRRGVSHSPVGLIKGMAEVATAKDATSLQKAITQLAEGLTGTGVVALGMYMGNNGTANGSLGEYGQEYKWKQLLGKQDYAINVGDYSITMDWAAPICMPFFVGVELGNSILKEGGNIWDAIESLSSVYEPVLEMSMLSGVQNLFDFSNSDSKDLVSFMSNAAQNLGSQFIPTLAGQVARTAVPERKIALSTAENKLQRDTEKYIDKMENKIPGLTNTNQSYVDMFGRTDSKNSTMDYIKAGLENFLSPAYISKANDGSVETELESLRQELGSEGKEVLPTDYSSNYDIRYEGEDHRMSEEQFTQYKKTRGQEAEKMLKDLFKSSEYKSMTNEEKKEAIEDVYDKAKETAKRETILAMGVVDEETYAYNELSKTNKEIVDSGIATAEEVEAASKVISDAGATSNVAKAYALLENGTTIRDLEVAEAMTSSNAVEKVAEYKKAGITLEDVQEANQIVKDSGYTKSVGKAYALLAGGASQTTAELMTSEKAVQRAIWLRQANVTPEQLDGVADMIDTNGNGSYTKDEITSFFSRHSNQFTTAQKRAIFLALNSSKNVPY